MKVRKIENNCKHTNGYVFSIRFRPEESSGCDTCGIESSQFDIYRYCKDCKDQMGHVDKWGVDDGQLDNLEFTSPEFETWFKEKKGEK